MTEKINTGDLVLDENGYFHMVYLISNDVKLYGMSNYYIGHINNCTLVLTDEKLQELRNSKDTPPFAVGEYYTSKTGIIFKITSKTAKEEIIAVKSLVDGEIIDGMIDTTEIMFRNSTPATAEQIATFKRAEQFAAKGRKLDEFRVGDVVRDEYGGTYKVTAINNGALYYCPDDIAGMSKECDLIQTPEELQEVGE